MKIYQLSGRHSSLVLAAGGGQWPQFVHWGCRTDLSGEDRDSLAGLLALPVPQAFLDEVYPPGLCPLWGNGGFSANALRGGDERQWAPQFVVAEGVESSGRLRFDGQDEVAGLELTFSLEMTEWDVLVVRAVLTNIGSRPYRLEELALSLVVPATADEIIRFHGRWIREFAQQRAAVTRQGAWAENWKGRTSHDNPPLLLVGRRGFSFEQGEVYGFHLGWSGNHGYRLQVVEDGRRLVQFAEKLFPGEVVLAPGESYTTPFLYASYTGCGLNGLSANFHSFIRDSGRFARPPGNFRPIHINTWEAMYFQHDQTMLERLVERAARLGIERFVLDDGWFSGRDHERAGLGDWFVDGKKYPRGLGPLIEKVRAAGMQFGLWFEPEMVNPDSRLFRDHPDWILAVDGYRQILGRWQYALNLGHPPVYAYVKDRLYDLLSRYPIDYIKWDMNRDLVQPGDKTGRPAVHRQVECLYRLLAEIRSDFPSVEIESCASGGGRIDLGILRYASRVWTSDCNDPLERQAIQSGFSLFFPLEMMGSHFGPQQSHTTGRQFDLEFRIFTAFFANLGFEQNLLELSEEECERLSGYIAMYKRFRPLIHRGRLWRGDTADPGQQIWAVTSEDRCQALVAVVQTGLPDNMLPGRLQLRFCRPGIRYQVEWLNRHPPQPNLMKQDVAISRRQLTVSGRVLATIGLQLPVVHPQTIMLFNIERH
ncbi:MAG: alpha-galactosidase [Negativicutes bacterium]|nr:alpha-galactosidase [Negativicutes bacterium]